MDKNELELVRKVLEKTAGYYADSYIPVPNGKTIHAHSLAWLHSHPERIDNPEYTEEEEKQFNSKTKTCQQN